MNTIAYHKTSKKTVDLIVSKMGQSIAKIPYENGKPLTETPKNMRVLIRWGVVVKTPLPDLTYNRAKAIKIASDKARCRKELQRAKKVAIPPMKWFEYPCIARRRKHLKGSGFWYCKNTPQMAWAIMRGARYFSSFYPKFKEYRVHVGHGMVLLVSKKIGDKENHLAWNYENGFRYKTIRWSKYRKPIVKMAIEAVKTARLDFGAVDIMADPVLPSLPPVVVLEINTAPALTDYSASRYAKYFDWLVARTHRREHKDIRGRARNYALRRSYLYGW